MENFLIIPLMLQANGIPLPYEARGVTPLKIERV